MHAFKQLIEACRRTGTTTALIKATKAAKGYLIVSNQGMKNAILKMEPKLEGHVFTYPEVNNGALFGAKSGTVFFDADAVWEIITQQEKKLPQVVHTEIGEDAINSLRQATFGVEKELGLKPQITITNCHFDGYQGLTIDTEDGLNIRVGDGYASHYSKQLNVKLTEEDIKDIKNINDDFFEGEAGNSMMGRILLRKGIQFYKKLRNSLDLHS